MIARHSVSDTVLDDLATGYGGVVAVRQLWRAQCSRRLLLLRLLVEKAGPDADSDAAVAAIVAADDRAETARDVLVEPMVGIWAAATIRQIAAGTATAQQKAHFGAVAAAASLRAGVAAELPGWTREGWLYLPASGRVRVPSDAGRVRLTVDAERLWVDGVEVDFTGPAWQERRQLSAAGEPGLTVFFEDLDPYRDAYHVPAAGRQSSDDVDAWRRGLVETWSILTELAPQRAAELAEGLHSLVPLRRPLDNAAHSATAKEAVGVVGLDLPWSPAEFAVALVHEFQHSKLSALLDLVSLHDSSSRRAYFAPWRADARPIGGLFQGVYAFLGVADTWRALSARPQQFPSAEQEFANTRAQVADAVATLGGSGSLTLPGKRFVQGMTQAVERLYAHHVPAAKVAMAERALAVRREAWRRVNDT